MNLSQRWQRVQQLVNLSKRPLSPELEGLQSEVNGKKHNYYRFLYRLALEFKPVVSLEIGTGTGVATAHLCAAAKKYGGYVIGIDLQSHEMTTTELNRRYGNFYFVQGNSTSDEVLSEVARLVKLLGDIGLVFQDSSHHYHASKAEWGAYSRFLGNQAMWVCDDIRAAFHDPMIDPPGRGMVQYWNEIPVGADRKQLFKNVLNYGNVQGVMLL